MQYLKLCYQAFKALRLNSQTIYKPSSFISQVISPRPESPRLNPTPELSS
jgi:hypothetical protein